MLSATDVCLVLPSRVIAVRESDADVELADRQRTTVQTLITPDVCVGDYVLVDRGFIIQAISADEAQTIINLYREMSSLAELP
jgi:hydrogenase expression/formation protein HypC